MCERQRFNPGSRKDGWRRRSIRTASEQAHIITPEAFRALYTQHLGDLITQKRIPSMALFEAFYNYCFVPKHTIGTQLLTVRRDKREREAYAESQTENDEFAEEVGMD
jgi:hypothetical protein